ncbi:MAG: DNA-binding protein [Bacteroidetes bacterium HGW-Bacteroidetes-19]|nr:MAG: DNA-binding protein [Bacteroidetes bacterium HGW-Bacteroidetes-19]
MDGIDKNDNGRDREEIFSKSVRAGKRTYFFDVKATKSNDYYLTITESKKRFEQDGKFFFEKHKLFLYKEDFEKFAEGLSEVVEYVKKNQPEIIERTETENDEFTDVKFEDLVEGK